MTGDIPIIETYKDVGIHDCQPRDRIERKVKPAIDYVMELDDVAALKAYAGNITRPPEARLLAGAKLQAIHQGAADDRRARPDIDVDYVKALTAGLSSQRWRDPCHYGSLLCVRSAPGGAGMEKRDSPLTDEQLGRSGC